MLNSEHVSAVPLVARPAGRPGGVGAGRREWPGPICCGPFIAGPRTLRPPASAGTRLLHLLRACPQKVARFSAQDMLQLFDFERALIDRMIPFDR
jgi:hypothetical protein